MTDLEKIGLEEGTDKTILGGNYLRHYVRIFDRLRNEPITLLEIGIADGASLRTWKRWFPRATIVGVDINPKCSIHAADRIIVEIGSQADVTFMSALSTKYRPTIIIDDGSHNSDHQIITLECLFPLMPHGGIYAIEDMFFQANPETAPTFRGSNPQMAIDYLAAAARDRTSWMVEDDGAVRRRSLVVYHLDRLEFLAGTAVLFKREKPLSRAEVVAMVEPVADSSFSVNETAWRRLFDYALYEQPDAAERAANQMLAIGRDEAWHAVRLAKVQETRKRLG